MPPPKDRRELELLDAVIDGNITIVKTLLPRIENLGRKKWEKTPLQLAAVHGHEDIMRLLVKAGVYVNAFTVMPGNAFQWTALHWAAKEKVVDSMEVLLELGANTAVQGRWGKWSGTALEWIRGRKGYEKVQLVLEGCTEETRNRVQVAVESKLQEVSRQPERPLRTLPKTLQDFESEFARMKKIGLLDVIPGINKQVQQRSRDAVLADAYASYMINRSPNHTTMLLLGESGVGKSSTINHLFGIDVAKTSGSESETRSTTEYLLTKDDPKSGIKDLSLGIIDTPGLNDTEGVEQDACNMACIKDMLANHDNLKPMTGEEQILPNIILVLIDSLDKRYKGTYSAFANSLRMLLMLGVVDEERNNVLVVMTRALKYSDYTDGEKWGREISAKANRIQQAAEDVLQFSPKVIWVENYFARGEGHVVAEGNESPRTLQRHGDWTILPDGTMQIRNLYQAIADMLYENGDNLAFHTINTMFKTPYKKTPTVSYTREALDATADRSRFGATEKDMIIYMKQFMGLRDPDSVESEVQKMIDRWMQDQKDKANMSKDEHKDASKLKLILSDLHITTAKELKEFSVGTIKQSMKLPHRLTPLHVKMLAEIFGVHDVITKSVVASYLGCGFDIFRDAVKPESQLYNFDSDYTHEEFGICLPKAVTLSKERNSLTTMDTFMSEQQYTAKRLSELQVDLDVTNYERFRMKMRPGAALISDAQNNGSMNFSYLTEKRLYKLSLNNLEDMSLSKAFETDLKIIPTSYDKSRMTEAMKIMEFFDKWGHFIVTGAFAGGSIEAKFSASGKQQCSDESFEIRARGKIKAIMTNIVSLKGVKNNNDTQSPMQLTSTALKLTGGMSEFQVNSLADLDNHAFQKWQSSVANKPSLLITSLNLEPIYEVVKDKERRNTLKMALYDMVEAREINTAANVNKEVKIQVTQKSEPAKTVPINRQNWVQKSAQMFEGSSAASPAAKNGIVADPDRVAKLRERLENRRQVHPPPPPPLKLKPIFPPPPPPSDLGDTRDEIVLINEQKKKKGWKICSIQ